jgi:glycine oxidase
METPDVLIVGGGIIGCALARELAQARLQVTVVERGSIGCGSSSAAAGLLSPSLATTPAGPLVDLCHDSAALFPDWIEQLTLHGVPEVGHRRSGLLELSMEPGEAARHADLLQAVHPDRPVEQLSEQQLRQREPALTSAPDGALFYANDAQVDPARLTRATARAAEAAGASLRENEPVHRLVREGDRISAVHTATASYWPGLVILAAGAWSGHLAELLGLDLPTHPVKGQLLLAACRQSPVHTPLHAGDALFVPQVDGSLILGVTVEEAGFDERPTLAGVRKILSATAAVVPAVADLPWQRAWAGLRPATPDGLPYMGPVPPLTNFWVSTGHFRKGILLAPICARLMAQSILADHLVEELEPFKPTRRLIADR